MGTAPTVVVLANQYRLDAVLGSGGLADVHAATNLVTGERVAVKVLRADGIDDVQRFDVEARVLASLDHPSIVRLRDAVDARPPFLVLDLVEGPTLADLLRQGPLPAERVWALGSELAGALAHAHGKAIVHRDVKPGNVLIADDGTARLSDFGIARLLDSSTVCLTATNQVIGTPAYLAPEQVEGRAVTPAADVYALGLVLLEALTGRRCFEGTTAETAIARLHRPPAVPDQVPPWSASLLAAMVSVDPCDRPSATEVARCLREHDAPAGAHQPLTVALEPAPRPTWRRAVPVAAMVALVVSALTFATGLADDHGNADAGSTGADVLRRAELIDRAATDEPEVELPEPTSAVTAPLGTDPAPPVTAATAAPPLDPAPPTTVTPATAPQPASPAAEQEVRGSGGDGPRGQGPAGANGNAGGNATPGPNANANANAGGKGPKG
jgi:eukaryotic-like serine/threonine-protein kinase